MSKTIKQPGGVLVRVVEALNGFRTKHGSWPKRLELDAETIAMLATQSLTPRGFNKLSSKVELVVGSPLRIVARGNSGEDFDYGDEGWRSPNGHRHDAMQWLGIAEG